jgi:hypothetical protein
LGTKIKTLKKKSGKIIFPSFFPSCPPPLKNILMITLFYYYSENDIALIIKYEFHDEKQPDQENCTHPESASNKRKQIEEQNEHSSPVKKLKQPWGADRKRQNIIDYSYIKLPALAFVNYLSLDCPQFLEDCLR